MVPNEPIPCGGNGDDFDDGLSNAYFPDGMWYTQTANVDGSGSVTVFADGESSEYTTYVAGQPNLHDSDTCQNCIAIAQEQERIRAQRDAEPYEHLFDHVGLASQESDGDDMELDLPPIFPEHDESKVLPCNGIQDIIFTGKVCYFFPYWRCWDRSLMYGGVSVDGRASWASLEPLQLLWTSSTMGWAYRHLAHVCELSIFTPLSFNSSS